MYKNIHIEVYNAYGNAQLLLSLFMIAKYMYPLFVNKDEDTIVNRISEKYKISTEEAKEYYNNYEKSQDQ